MRIMWLAVAVALAVPAQQPAGGVSGRVLAGPDGPPVRGAAVRVTRVHEELALGWTGQEGRFTIDGVPPGRYVLIATKPAFGQVGVAVDIRAGETTRDVDIPLEAPAVLAGGVVDADDLPVEGGRASIELLGRRRGRLSPERIDVAESDDRGEFRATVGQPGRYLVVLQPPFKPDLAGVFRLLHPPLFYPNALNPAEAQPIRLGRGMKIETLDFETPPPADTRVIVLAKASEVGKQARSCTQCDFSLQARHAETWLEVLAGQSSRQGRIEIAGLHPGSYRIAVTESATGELYAGYEDIITARLGETQSFDVTAWGVNTIPLTLTLVDPPESVLAEDVDWEAGVRAEAIDPRYPGKVEPPPADLVGRGAAARGRLMLPPGEWALRLYANPPLPDNAYIEQVTLGGRPQPGPFVRVSRQGHAPPVEVRVGFDFPTLTGKVVSADPKNRQALLVRAIADPPGGYGLDADLIAGPDGTFATTELPPGAYRLFAVLPGARELDFSDPEVQSRYAGYGKRVTLDPGESRRIELEAVP